MAPGGDGASSMRGLRRDRWVFQRNPSFDKLKMRPEVRRGRVSHPLMQSPSKHAGEYLSILTRMNTDQHGWRMRHPPLIPNCINNDP